MPSAPADGRARWWFGSPWRSLCDLSWIGTTRCRTCGHAGPCHQRTSENHPSRCDYIPPKGSGHNWCDCPAYDPEPDPGNQP